MKHSILFVVNVDWFFVSHRLPIAMQAIENGYDVHLACAFTDKRDYLEKLGITCHHIFFSRSGISPHHEFFTLFSLFKLLNTNNYCIVHAVTLKPVIYIGFLLKFLKQPPSFVAAISGLGYVFSATNIRAKFTKFIVSQLYKIALFNIRKLVIFQNSTDMEVLSNIVSLSSHEKVLIKGSGVDLSVYSYTPEPSDINKVVTMASRLLKEKGVYDFVNAARIIKADHPNVEFWLVGSVDTDNPNSISQSEIDSWVSEGTITAFGHRNDIHSIFAQSHIVSLPSYYGEGVPKVLIEAAACGRPIVTTDRPGCKDSIIDKRTGLLTPVKNPELLASNLISLLFDNELRVAMGMEARLYAVSQFDLNNVVSKHLDIYESLICRL